MCKLTRRIYYKIRNRLNIVEKGITCGSRMEQMGPWDRKEGLDNWTTGRWRNKLHRRWVKYAHRDYERSNKIDAFLRKLKDKTGIYISWYHGGTLWEWGKQPRNCTFCGSVHPDDAIEFINKEWTLHRAKGYKYYLNPSEGPHPVPPVKLYTWHVSKEQADALNKALGVKDKAA